MIDPTNALVVALAALTLAAAWRRRASARTPARAPARPRNHVYVIAYRSKRGRAIGPSKIGIAKDPEQRLRTFQTANPRPLMLYKTYPVARARALEQAVHRHLRPVRMKGEWFALPPERAARAVRTVMKRPRRSAVPTWARFSLR